MLLDEIASQADSALAPSGYRLGEIIGHGGMGVVYELHPLAGSTEPMAVKMTHPSLSLHLEAEQKLKEEAEIELSLQDLGCIVQTLEYGVHAKGHGYKIMRRMKGESLKAWLKRNPSRLERNKVYYQLALALEAIHARGITHGDLKPNNIFVDPETFRVTLFDFGEVSHRSSVSSTPPVESDANPPLMQ